MARSAGEETERRPHLRDQADELPGPHPDLQAGPQDAIATCRCGLPNSARAIATSRPARCTACMRVRGFTQDDAHIFCTEEQMAAECLEDQRPDPLDLRATSASTRSCVKLSTRPEKRVGSDEAWDRAEAIMMEVLEAIAAASGRQDQDRHQPGRGRLLRAEVRIRAARRHRPRLAVRHARRSTSSCPSGSARSMSPRTARRRRR